MLGTSFFKKITPQVAPKTAPTKTPKQQAQNQSWITIQTYIHSLHNTNP